MKLGTNKWTVSKRKHSIHEDNTLQGLNVMQDIKVDETYKYLGYEQKTGIERANVTAEREIRRKILNRIIRIKTRGVR